MMASAERQAGVDCNNCCKPIAVVGQHPMAIRMANSFGMRVALALLLFATSARAGFDWGAGCEGGSGQFITSIAAGTTVDVGSIPAGKWTVVAKVTASSDVDVQLFDADDTTTYAEGKAIVAWVEDPATANGGALGAEEGEAAATYEGMHITYSGYGGVGGSPGKEFIRIDGEATRTLNLKAFAFEAGDALVEYSWGRTQTPCCMATAACGGSLTLAVEEGASADVGEIPVGKNDLRVTLVESAGEDVDVQLYDLGDTSKWPGGAAIVAYCESASGNCGPLGNNDGSAETATYGGLEYAYSGYMGVDGNAGNEFVQVSGVTNTQLSMKVFGYAAGTAAVTYEYYEVVPDDEQTAVAAPSVDLRVAANGEALHTAAFSDAPANTLIVRRSATFTVLVARSGLTTAGVAFAMSGAVDADGDYADYVDEAYPAAAMELETVLLVEGIVELKVTLSADAPVGA